MGAREIPLTRGFVAIVDEENFARLAAHKWHFHHCGYARRTVHLGYGRGAPTAHVFMHRDVISAQPGQIVDHINGNKLDNRRDNLRLTDRAGNCRNKVHTKNRKRGLFKGVYLGRSGKWEAKIGTLRDGRKVSIHIGSFVLAEDAARAYDAAAREHFGEFAATNFPEVAA